MENLNKIENSKNTSEDIRFKAYDIFLNRMKTGINGSAEQDWSNAIEVLQDNKISDLIRINEMSYHKPCDD
jgi:hypothetical protein